MPRPKLSDASSQFGASIGRRNRIEEPDAPIRFYLYRLRWVDGDYDEGGAYWGHGTGDSDIYRAVGDGPEYQNEMFTRARDRAEAKRAVLAKFPRATFYR